MLQTVRKTFLQVPGVYWHLSSKRILTMEFADGGQVNDKNYMQKHGINVNEVPPDPVQMFFVTHSHSFFHQVCSCSRSTHTW